MQLAEIDTDKYAEDELLSCVTNRVQIHDCMHNPKHRFKGPNGPVLAAIRIQTAWRGYKAYSSFAQLKFFMEKTTII